MAFSQAVVDTVYVAAEGTSIATGLIILFIGLMFFGQGLALYIGSGVARRDWQWVKRKLQRRNEDEYTMREFRRRNGL